MSQTLTAPGDPASSKPTGHALRLSNVEPEQSKPFHLRDYQVDCITQIQNLWQIGQRAPLLYAPTGAGKTAMAAHIMNTATCLGHKTLFVVHREPLVAQTVVALQVYGIDAGFIKAGYEVTDGSQPVIIASIQTLARRQFPENIGQVIIDECHTTAWYDTYEKLKRYYSGGVLATSKVRFLGLTGSPWRTKSNTQYMGQHFDAIVRAPTPSELIQMGYLCPPRHFGWGGLADWSQLETGDDGDFNQRQAEFLTINAEFNQLIVEKYLNFSEERTAISFAQSVEQSRLLTELFNAAGIACEHLEASTHPDIRREMYLRLASGETRILSSVATLCEGFNEPSISAVILARPTKSLSLLIQMSGRGLRLAPGKKDCLLLDFCENYQRLGFVTRKHKISLCPQFKFGAPSTTKECPSCHAYVYSFARICPECGYEFPPSEPSDESDEANFFPDFGELLSDEDRVKFSYLRSQLKIGYKKGLNPDRNWHLFRKKFGHLPPNDWHLGAVFKGHNSQFHINEYREFLYSVNPKASDPWMKFHLELEFGRRQKKYKTPSGKTFTPPAVSTKRLEWWEVLEVDSLDNESEIKSAYRRQARYWHPDVSQVDSAQAKNQMQLINWAFEEASNESM